MSIRNEKIAVRFFTHVTRKPDSQSKSRITNNLKETGKKKEEKKSSYFRESHNTERAQEINNHHEVIVFDTETTSDKIKNLLFAQFMIVSSKTDSLHHILDGKKDFLHQPDITVRKYLVIVHPKNEWGQPSLTEKEIKIIEKYGKNNHYEEMPFNPDGSGPHYWYTDSFIENILLPKLIQGIPLIGFNLPFDIAHLAINVTTTKNKKVYNFKFLSDTKSGSSPLIALQPIDSKKAFMKLRYPYDLNYKWVRLLPKNNSIMGVSYPKGRFIDLRTTIFALTNNSHSLKSAGISYQLLHQKIEAEEHGKITEKYLEYNTQDVYTTFDLYCAVMQEYKRHVALFDSKGIETLYSPASMGKGYLKAMHIKPFNECNPDFPKELMGYAMSAFYAGRSETHIKNTPIKTAHVDFTSMYPSVYVLQDLWKFIIADHYEHKDVTEKVRKWVKDLTIETLLDKETWKELRVLVKIQPHEDLLPVRAQYALGFNIGLNYLTTNEALWYALSDIVNAKILTGKTPEILEAIELIPVGEQKGLSPISFFGEIDYNPYMQDFFKTVIEERSRIKKEAKTEKNPVRHAYLMAVQLGLKILANATSYGINVELNDKDIKEDDVIDIYSKGVLKDVDLTERGEYEGNGYYFNPFIAVFITSASHLMLGILQKLIQDREGTFALMDTDSAFIVDRKDLDKPITEQKGNPLLIAKEVIETIQPLYPYSDNGQLLKLEDDNFRKDQEGNTLDLYVYSVASKRYATFVLNHTQTDLEVVEGKEHGLPYRKPLISYGNPLPFMGTDFRFLQAEDSNDVKTWGHALWESMLYKEILEKELSLPFVGYQPLVMGYNITQVSDYLLVNNSNNKTDYFHRVKPYDFMLRLISEETHGMTDIASQQIIPQYFCRKHHIIGKGFCHNWHLCDFRKTCLANRTIVAVTPNMENPFESEGWEELRTGLKIIQNENDGGQIMRKLDDNKSDCLLFIPMTYERLLEKHLQQPEMKYDDSEGNPCTIQTRGELQPCHVHPTDILYHGKEMRLANEDETQMLSDETEDLVISPSHNETEEIEEKEKPTKPKDPYILSITKWDEINKTINQEIEQRNISVTKLAKKMRLPKSRISEYLSGKRTPKYETIMKLYEWVKGTESGKKLYLESSKRTTKKMVGPNRKENDYQTKVYNAKDYFKDLLTQAQEKFPSSFITLYHVSYVTVNDEIANWKKETQKKKEEERQEALKSEKKDIPVKYFGQDMTLDYNEIAEKGKIRYIKKRIKGNKVVNLIEIMMARQIYNLIIVNSYVRFLMKEGLLPEIKNLKKIAKKPFPQQERISQEPLQKDKVLYSTTPPVTQKEVKRDGGIDKEAFEKEMKEILTELEASSERDGIENLTSSYSKKTRDDIIECTEWLKLEDALKE